MTNILILGKTGMLGSMLYYYFSKQGNYQVFTTSRNNSTDRNLTFDAESPDFESLSGFISGNGIEYILNAIGVIKPFCKDDDPEGVRRAILVNASFPHRLAQLSGRLNTRLIQIATDCVYDGSQGTYDENSPHNALDFYGRTKSLGEVRDGSMLNIRCSIVGPEAKSKVSLLEWFLKQESEVKGFTHHNWNGITTLRFAQLIDEIIKNGMYNELVKKSHVLHFVPDYTLTKYEMLEIFRRVFEKSVQITPVNDVGTPIDRTLATIFSDLKQFSNINFEDDIRKLKDLMDKDFYTYQTN